MLDLYHRTRNNQNLNCLFFIYGHNQRIWRKFDESAVVLRTDWHHCAKPIIISKLLSIKIINQQQVEKYTIIHKLFFNLVPFI